MKERITPTHFIEVWGIGDKVYIGNCYELDMIENCLLVTKNFSGGKTIAIWKIKFKNK